MEYRRIVKQAREQLLTSAKAHFKSIINNRIANGVEDEITDWDEYPFYSIDLWEYNKYLKVSVWEHCTYDEDFQIRVGVSAITMDKDGDIYIEFDTPAESGPEPIEITELNTDDFQAVVDLLIEIDE